MIKREHRSGMHISSYIVSHMVYQAFLCLAQTAVTLYVTQLTGVKYPEAGAAGPVCAGFRPAGDCDAGVYRQRQAMRPRRAAGIPIDPGFVPVR